jgi:hypothetical protein
MGMNVDVSTQTPDFESEVVTMTREAALQHFSTWPWRKHLDRQQEMEAAGEEACPPSMGFGTTDRNVFIANVRPGVFDLYIHFSRTSRRFGLFTKKEDLDWDIPGANAEFAARFIETIFVDDDDDFIAFANSNSTGAY